MRTFSKATVSSILATVADFCSLYFFVEFLHIYYVAATAMAAVCGAITNFSINRTWTFNEQSEKKRKQILKYAMVSGASLSLNTLLVYLFTEFAGLLYLKSKLVAAILVGWLWNYPLQKYFVFVKKTQDQEDQRRLA